MEGKSQAQASEGRSTGETGRCPVELLLEFLELIKQQRMPEAGDLCRRMLSHEPNNEMFQRYSAVIAEYIEKGVLEVLADDDSLDDFDEDEDNDDEEDGEEEDDEDEDEEEDDANEEEFDPIADAKSPSHKQHDEEAWR